MPQDLKFGIIIAVGVFVAVGTKRISLREGDASEEKPAAAVALNDSTTDKFELPEVPAPEIKKEVAKAKQELSKSVDKAKEKSTGALAKDFPKDLRKKVEQTSKEAGESLPALDLPDLGTDDLAVPAPPKTTKSEPKASSVPAAKAREEKLPPVRTRDVERASRSGGDAKTSLELPGTDWLDESGLKSKADEAGFKKPGAPSLEDDFPKPLPDANDYGAKPIHPYFKRFLKEGTYYVRDGDTLKDIAHNLYQDESMAAKILEANRDILKESGDLKSGLRLKLPK